jgi:type IV pilus assembly protein PilY1
MLRKFLLSFLIAIPVGLAPLSAPADDTDIYVDPDTPDQGQPMVMFTIDTRANITSTSESPYGPLYTFFYESTTSPDIAKKMFEQLYADNGGTVFPPTAATVTKMYFIDTILLSMAYVMADLADVKVGMIISHNDAGTSTASSPEPPLCNQGSADLPTGTTCVAKNRLGPTRDCDGDGINNNVDGCPTINGTGGGSLIANDPEGDKCGNACDNCDNDVNADQKDTDGDGIGDACDPTVTTGGSSGFVAAPTGSKGGVILQGFQSLNDPTTLDAMLAKIRAVKLNKLKPNSADHPYQGAYMFYEFFRYLTGQGIYNGHNGAFDFESGGGIDVNTNMACTDADPDKQPACYDSAIESGTKYISPLTSDAACARIFTVNLMFGNSNDTKETAAQKMFTDARTAGGLGYATPPSSEGEYFTGMISFLRDTDLAENPILDEDDIGETFGTLPELGGFQNVTSYFVLPDPQDNQVGGPLAIAGGTDAALELKSDPQGLVDALSNIFQQILSVSTTFVAASVPVNVFNRAEIVDNVYFALFQAQDGGSTTSDAGLVVPGGPAVWPGNLKKLKLGTEDVLNADGDVVGSKIVILDADNEKAISELDGRILNDARTYWTDVADPHLVAGDLNGDGIVEPTALSSVSPQDPLTVTAGKDGRHVSRGAAGQKIPGFKLGSGGPGDANATGKRNVFYLNSAGALAPLNVTTTVADEVGPKLIPGYSAGATYFAGTNYRHQHHALKMLKYIRGQDVNDEDGQVGTANIVNFTTRVTYTDPEYTESRNWLMGDPLHSRPLPINYGAPTLTNVLNGNALETYTKDDPTTAADESNSAIFIAMAGNDGLLRLIRNTNAAGAEDGQEVWSFMPPEAMSQQQRLMDGRDPVDGEYFHPYSFDGEPTGMIIDQNGNGTIDKGSDADRLNDKVYLFIGLRRAGRVYYAFDITNPYDPKFLWKISNDGLAKGSYIGGNGAIVPGTETHFAQLGLSFSKPRAGAVFNGYDGDVQKKRLALFFGGGYDGGPPTTTNSVKSLPGKDARGVGTNDTIGNAVFVVSATTGELIWKAVGGGSLTYATTASKTFVHPDLTDSVPSNLTVIDSNGDGLHDRILFGDTGGNVWRADLGFDDTVDESGNDDSDLDFIDQWKLVRLACLGRHAGCSGGTTKADDRRFFHEPDMVQVRDGTSRYDAVIIGSGDRENPLDRVADTSDTDSDETREDPVATNRIYVIRDGNTGVGKSAELGYTNASLLDVTLLAQTCADTDTACKVQTTNGWRMDLTQTAEDGTPGEKSLSAPITIADAVFFTSYVPPARDTSKTCGPGEGKGRIYALKLANADPVYNYDTTNAEGSLSDRSLDLGTPGIPAQVVFLGSSTGLGGAGGSESEGKACQLNILAGAKIFQAPGCPRFRTFWQRVGS